MAAAGPAANVFLAASMLVAIKLGMALGFFAAAPGGLHAWSELVVPAGAFRESELYPLTPSVMAAPEGTISFPVIPLRSLQAPV